MATICLYTTAKTSLLIIWNPQSRIMNYHQIAVHTVNFGYQFTFHVSLIIMATIAITNQDLNWNITQTRQKRNSMRNYFLSGYVLEY